MPFKVGVRELRYGGRTYFKDDPIAPAEKDVRVMRAVGRIVEAPAGPVRKAKTPRPPKRASALTTDVGSGSGRYLNRRMRSED
jgi:hypothetical protein